jgi:ABC-2 type transport system permease protein
MTLSFWVTRAEALHSLYTDFFSLSGYPASIYQGAMRFFFTFIIPVVVVANFPVMIVIKLLNPIYTLYALAISLLFFTLSRTFFKFALKYYSSASS